MTDEKADLDQLLKSPGWLRVMEHARQTWKEGYPQLVKLAIQQALADKSDVGAAVAKVDYASDEINKLLSWPQERLKRLIAATVTTTSFARGGYDAPSPR